MGEEFFDVAKYPTITFTSKSLKFDGDKLVGANGDFTLHGVTKPVSLQIDHFRCAPHPMNKKAHLRRQRHHHDQAFRVRHLQVCAGSGRRSENHHPGRSHQGLKPLPRAGEEAQQLYF